MGKKISPLALVILISLSGINAWLLNLLLAQFEPEDLVLARSAQPKGVNLITTEEIPPTKPLSLYGSTLAQPVFFRTRKPYVPPPPVAVQTPIAAPPAPVVNPGFSITGVFIKNGQKRAYILKQGDRIGAWVNEGETLVGWTLQSVMPTSITLAQGGRTIELELYLKP
jgi:hypothetical protein